MNPSEAAGIEPPPVTQPIDMSWLLKESGPTAESQHRHGADAAGASHSSMLRTSR